MLKVSVLFLTYNQENYIAQALDSVLMQTVNFEYEIVLSEDCSSDRTRYIAKDYQSRYPDRIRLLLNEKNLGMHDNFVQAWAACQGEYVALLEGDDYWTSPDKLQKQVDFLDQHPECSMCFHNGAWILEGSDEEPRLHCTEDLSEILTTEDILYRNLMLTAAIMYRRGVVQAFPKWFSSLKLLDWPLQVLHSQKGKVGYINQVMSVYRIHQSGVWNSQTPIWRLQETIRLLQILDIHLEGEYHAELQRGISRYQSDLIATAQHPFQAQINQYQHECNQLQHQLTQAQQQTAIAQTQLTQTQSCFYEVQTVLAATQAKLLTAQESLHDYPKLEGEAEQLRSQVHQVSVQLDQVKKQLNQEKKRVQIFQAGLDQFRGRVEAIETSKFWKIRRAWFGIKGILGRTEDRFVPPNIELQLAQIGTVKSLEQSKPVPQPQPYSEEQAYEQWMQRHTPTAADLRNMTGLINIFATKPLISVIMPVYNPPIEFLKGAIDSVLDQIYPHWELCIADDLSPNPEVRQVLEEYRTKDNRIKVCLRSENGHISNCSNSALELATGEFIALLDHDDLLAPEALYEMALMLNKHPEADMIYSDEDKVDEKNRRKRPFFKPDWCPDSFLSRMYTCHFGGYRRSLINEIGGFRTGFEGSQDYDLVLRLTEKTDSIFHIPKILYHWRVHEESTAFDAAAKPYAHTAAKQALTEALQRRGETGQITDLSNYPGRYVVRYDIQKQGLVSIIIPTKDLGNVLNQCLESIFQRTSYPNYEVIVVDNGSSESYTQSVFKYWLNQEPERFRCYAYNIPFNYSKLNNFGVSKSRGQYLLFLNNDTEVVTPEWIEAMLEQAQRPTIGAVGAMLLYPDDTIQHAGVILGLGGVAGHSHKFFSADAPGYYDQLLGSHNISAVTGACLMCRREVFDAVNGFNEELAVAFNDVDFCLKILKAGFRNLFTPLSILYHYESKSRGYEDTPEKQKRFSGEADQMQSLWGEVIGNDPCYNIHLTRTHEDFRIRDPEEAAQKQLQELSRKLKESNEKLKRKDTQLEEKTREVDTAIGRIQAMETSKFWKLRASWFRLKKFMKLLPDE
jgi:O-antigen biosynthesis protein